MKEIEIYSDWNQGELPVKMGILRAELSKGEEVFSFEYSEDWMANSEVQFIDPDLNFYKSSQYLSGEKSNFGMFLDSSPDRWGRMLMKRREAIIARTESRKPIILRESDFLLGVYDETRMGALRFKISGGQYFLEFNAYMKTPPYTLIRELEQASLKIEDEDYPSDSEAMKWLNLLLAPGSSLGGARPKASVRHNDGSLWIAKFPSKNDDKNSGAWEFIVHTLGNKLSLNFAVAESSVFSQKHHTFLSKRFDRSASDGRIHFASAMTLLGYKDGHSHREGGSYLEIAEIIENYGASPEEDLQELWRRIVFSVAVSNTDDHLRNHGFLLSEKGWRLSPAYDVNPNESGTGLSLNISENDNSLDYDLCLSVADFFRYKYEDAVEFVAETKRIVSSWHYLAEEMNVSRREQSEMAYAFRVK